MKRRKSIPVSVKLEVAMAALRKYLGVDRLEFDHRPALWEREWDEEAQDTIPPANDPNFIDLVDGEEHDRRTFGTKATSYGSDAHERAKAKRLRGETKTGPKKAIPPRGFPERPKGHSWVWPTRKMTGRPF